MKKIWNNVDLDLAIRLLKEGKKYQEIADVLNRTEGSVRRKLSSVGLTYETINPKPSVNCSENEKYCGTCKEIKNKDDFNKNKSKSDGLNSICRECSNKRSKKYYGENIIHHRKEVRKRNEKINLENQIKVIGYLKNNPCVDCGENNVVFLDFDHKDDVDKINNISNMLNESCSWGKIKNEIDKCDVRCANCHRLRTAKQQDWYRKLINLGVLDKNYNII